MRNRKLKELFEKIGIDVDKIKEIEFSDGWDE
jgi:hypothetical protein